MQASRASSRVLRAVAAGSKQTRGLHMTGSATYSNLLNSERRALNLPRDIAGLQAECQKRKLPTVGSENELLNRLTAHEMASSRAFSTAVRASKRPTTPSASAGTPARHFNTSRTLKAVNDTSTIDFAYVPDFDPDAASAPIVRVPILPQTTPSEISKAHTAVDTNTVQTMLPTIVTVAADGTHIHSPSALAEAADIDFQGIAAKFASTFSGPSDPKDPGMAREIWSGFVEDILGPKSQSGPKA
ncbi:hypothetical protein K505DRAFT_241453 [Melanomma pulvis-pyrius CBS 109.77]|uniref:SAP domain-containing protein n=1 Tax=Melanomma pulvis-pyrius CBS 109.77 TaxID=1314802 RepID=A0A6A6XFB0_9PLEO|nr:hypothetical protein K505DRAFT_241453 [Melanomma pulvis-pyrius CBS 109.77]